MNSVVLAASCGISIKLSATTSRYVVAPSESVPKTEKFMELGRNIGLGVGAKTSKRVTVVS